MRTLNHLSFISLCRVITPRYNVPFLRLWLSYYRLHKVEVRTQISFLCTQTCAFQYMCVCVCVYVRVCACCVCMCVLCVHVCVVCLNNRIAAIFYWSLNDIVLDCSFYWSLNDIVLDCSFYWSLNDIVLDCSS